MTEVTCIAQNDGLSSLPKEQTTHRVPHIDCPACAWALRLATDEKKMADMGLFKAGETWLAGKVGKRLLPKTIECCEGNLRALKLFFGDTPLRQFNAGSFKAYQIERHEGRGVFSVRGPAGASAINHELNVLQQILRKAGLWEPIKDFYAPLSEPYWKPPKTFTVREEKIIFDAAASNAEVELFEIVAKITRNTTASGCELRGIRLRHLDMAANPPRVQIPPDSVKNDIRPRVIPLNVEAEAAFRRALDRAARLGSFRPEHYLFPFRINRKYWDPNRPASKSWLRKQTEKMRAATGIPHIRPHAFRHLAVTELLESGAPEQTVIAIAGWVSRNMINTYSHARIEAKAEALKMLDKKPVASVPSQNKKNNSISEKKFLTRADYALPLGCLWAHSNQVVVQEVIAGPTKILWSCRADVVNAVRANVFAIRSRKRSGSLRRIRLLRSKN